MKEINTEYLTCPIRNVIDRFGDKWSLLILYHLHKGGILRFGEIYHEMTDISEKMLSTKLKDLERDHLVRRKSYPVILLKWNIALRHWENPLCRTSTASSVGRRSTFRTSPEARCW